MWTLSYGEQRIMVIQQSSFISLSGFVMGTKDKSIMGRPKIWRVYERMTKKTSEVS